MGEAVFTRSNNVTKSYVDGQISNYISKAEKGVSNGVVPLDEDVHIDNKYIGEKTITTEKLASGASIDKWKNWKHYDGISELNLTSTTCTLDDICSGMVSKSRMTFAGNFSSYTTLLSELPWNRGQLIIQKLDNWNCHLEFYAEDLPSNQKLHAEKRWVGQWRTKGNLSNFMGWYQVFTESELIPLNAINTGEYEDNLFNSDNFEDDCYYDASTGNKTTSSGVSSSGVISVVPGDKLFTFVNTSTNSNHQFTFYDTNGDYLTGFNRVPDANKEIDFEVPKGAASMRFSFYTTNKSDVKLGHKSIRQDKLSDYVKELVNEPNMDKWKGVIRYNKVSELGLDINTCTIDEIISAMPNNSYLEAEKSGTTVNNAFPETYGVIMINKLTSWKVSLKFSTDTTNSGTGNRVRVWEGTWREGVKPAFSGWKKVYTSNELISLSDIDTGEVQDNLFVAENCTDGGYYNCSTLQWVSADGVSETEFMPCNEGEHFTFYTGQVNAGFHIVFKNSSGEIFTGIRCNSNANKIINFTTPYGAVSFACAFNTSYKSEIQIGHSSIPSNTLNEYIKSVNNDFFKGKKMNCLGDSITYGSTPSSGSQMSNPYPIIVKELLGLDTVRNYGISGSSLAVGGDNPMVTRYTNMDNDADIVCVFGGTNDWGKTDTSKQRELGTIDSTDNTTVYGALNEMCSGLISKYPKATIFLVTPLHRTNETTPNTHSYILEDVAIAIKEVGAKFAVPVLDLFSSGNFYPTNSTQNTNCSGDGLHPNQWFHENVLGVKIAEFIRGGCVSCGGTGNIIKATESQDGLMSATDKEKLDKLYDELDETYYVDAANGNDNNNGSQQYPLATIQKAIDNLPNILKGSATINVANGTYNEVVDIRGKFGGQILINGTATSTNKTACSVYGIKVRHGCSGIYLDGLTATGYVDDEIRTSFMAYEWSDLFSITNCYSVFTYKPSEYDSYGVYAWGSPHVILDNCEFSNKKAGAYSSSGSVVNIKNCNFTNNDTHNVLWSGGEIIRVSSNTFTGGTELYKGEGGHIINESGELM